MEPFHRQFLHRLGADGSFVCSCGRRHLIGTRRVLMGEGVLEELPYLLRERYTAGARVWTLSDENTEKAAGTRCKELLSSFAFSETILPGSPKPKPVPELAEELCREAARCSPQLVLSVGAGVISDLGKKVSHDLGIPSWCIATAPSVDAYSSGHSVFKSHSGQQSIPAAPSEYIFCEIPVLAAAPRTMFLAGVGDLLGKFLACLDWSISALLTGEYICADFIHLARDSAMQALQALQAAPHSREAVPALTDALLTTGFLMQALGHSRPASSTEHTAALVWEVSEAVGNPALNLHGLLVGLASLLVLEAYRVFYGGLADLPIDIPKRIQALLDEPSWERRLAPAMLSFAEHIRCEVAGMERSPQVWQRRLAVLLRERERVLRLAQESLRDLEQGVTALSAAGFPFSTEEYGLTRSAALLPFPYIRLLRNRYNTFTLMHEVGQEGEPLEALERLV